MRIYEIKDGYEIKHEIKDKKEITHEIKDKKEKTKDENTNDDVLSVKYWKNVNAFTYKESNSQIAQKELYKSQNRIFINNWMQWIIVALIYWIFLGA